MFLGLAAVAGGFWIYLSSQRPVAIDDAKQAQTPLPNFNSSGPTAGMLGPGSRPRFKALDSQRRLSYTFRADDYESRPGNRIQVRNPEVEFFQYVREGKDPSDPRTRTQRVRLVGKTGTVELARAAAEASADGIEPGPAGPPKRGVLYDVTIQVVPDITTERVSTTLVTPNIAFDNETFEITSQAYQAADGTPVAADRVPVVASGDYEFVGQGLTLRWNDVDGRLELLEIAHGQYLQVNDLEALGKGGFGTGDAKPATRPGAAQATADDAHFTGPLRDEAGAPIALAAADKAAGAKAGSKAKPKPKKAAQPPYRATFDGDVRVSQGVRDVAETPLAQADIMQLEFASGSKSATTQPATQPATAPAIATSPATRPATGPATKPAAEPIIVRWTGKLRVLPMDEAEHGFGHRAGRYPASGHSADNRPGQSGRQSHACAIHRHKIAGDLDARLEPSRLHRSQLRLARRHTRM